MKIVCLDGYAMNPGDLSWDDVAAQGELTVHDRTPADQIVARAADAEAILTNKTPLSAETLTRLAKLKYVGVLATGFNIVDVDAARERGVVVTNVPAYSTDSVAELVFAFIGALARRPEMHAQLVHDGAWQASDDFAFWRSPQVELAGRPIGVFGCGRIGQRVIELASAYRMHVLACSRSRSADLPPGGEWVDVDAMFARADVVTLHAPLTPETRDLVNADRLARMKPTAFLINTSRGPIVDEHALADALRAGRIAGAAVDVLDAEPPRDGSPLIGAPNCIITPHLGWATAEARARPHRAKTCLPCR